MLMPMAMDREKKTCPDAVFSTSKKLPGLEKRLMSGLNMNL